MMNKLVDEMSDGELTAELGFDPWQDISRLMIVLIEGDYENIDIMTLNDGWSCELTSDGDSYGSYGSDYTGDDDFETRMRSYQVGTPEYSERNEAIYSVVAFVRAITRTVIKAKLREGNEDEDEV